MEPTPEGKVRCTACHEIVRPDRVDVEGVCEHCIVLDRAPLPPEEDDAA